LQLKAWHEALFHDIDYRVLLASFGTHLLFNTGSRRSRRQHEINPVEGQDALHLRAIPHNAILQQLGYVAHAIGGIGTATRMERERFIETCRNSPRLLSFMTMIAHIKRNSSLSTVTAYASLVDPGYWSARVHAGGEATQNENFRHLVRLLDDDHRATAIKRAVHRLREDEFDLHTLFEAIDLDAQPAPDERLDTDLLHATRIAVIMHIFLLAMRIPHFSTRDDITQDDILKLILRLDIPPALELLRIAFPVAASDEGDIDLTETASYRADPHSGYQELNENLLDGIDRAYDLTRRIGIAISHHYGAHG
ncbi:MAG: phosphoenolpyruvate carboxylase, partial [Alphaproteobacteria bacterium]